MNKKDLKKIRKELDIAMQSGIEENINWIDSHGENLLNHIDKLQLELDKLKTKKDTK